MVLVNFRSQYLNAYWSFRSYPCVTPIAACAAPRYPGSPSLEIFSKAERKTDPCRCGSGKRHKVALSILKPFLNLPDLAAINQTMSDYGSCRIVVRSLCPGLNRQAFGLEQSDIIHTLLPTGSLNRGMGLRFRSRSNSFFLACSGSAAVW